MVVGSMWVEREGMKVLLGASPSSFSIRPNVVDVQICTQSVREACRMPNGRGGTWGLGGT